MQQQPPQVSNYQTQCAQLLKETAVRVVELMYHPLGVQGLIVVVEFVHNRMWTANSRFVALDAYKVCRAIQFGGFMPSPLVSKIDLLDQEVSYCNISYSISSYFSYIYFDQRTNTMT